MLDTHGNRKLLKKSANLGDGLNFTSKRTLPRRLSATDDSGDDSESESTDDRKSKSKFLVPTQIQAIDLDSANSDALSVSNFLETQTISETKKNQIISETQKNEDPKAQAPPPNPVNDIPKMKLDNDPITSKFKKMAENREKEEIKKQEANCKPPVRHIKKSNPNKKILDDGKSAKNGSG